jgi:hypothetical protein
MPPSHFWWGRDLVSAKSHRHALRRLGAEIFEFDTAPFCRKDFRMLRQQIEDARRFRPDAAVSTPHAGYAAAVKWFEEGASGELVASNVFLDVLHLPTVLYWDHVLTQAPMYVMPEWPAAADDSRRGVIEQLRALFNHPLAYHFFPDSGHIAEVDKLGLGKFEADNYYVPGVQQEFVRYGERSRRQNGVDANVAFFGNLFLTAATRSGHAQAELMAIRRHSLALCAADWEVSPFTAYSNTIDSLGSDVRGRLRLDYDQIFRWKFLAHEVSTVANGEPRLHKLQACGRPVTYFGGFADPESRKIAVAAGLVIGEDLAPDRRLAAAFQRTTVSLDVANAAFINCCPLKLLTCFAAGGFMLTTRRADIARPLGNLADAITFAGADELVGKVEHYLSSNRARTDLANEIAAVVRGKYSILALFARTVPLALERIRER